MLFVTRPDMAGSQKVGMMLSRFQSSPRLLVKPNSGADAADADGWMLGQGVVDPADRKVAHRAGQIIAAEETAIRDLWR